VFLNEGEGFFTRSLLLSVPLHIRRDHVLKIFGPALLLASGLAITAAPVRALQIVVTQVGSAWAQPTVVRPRRKPWYRLGG
jgi:hypothetical protein